MASATQDMNIFLKKIKSHLQNQEAKLDGYIKSYYLFNLCI